jgi:hypothetical protein
MNFKILLQISFIVLDIEDITLHLKRNTYALHHLDYANPSSGMRDVTTGLKLLCIVSISGVILMLIAIF